MATFGNVSEAYTGIDLQANVLLFVGPYTLSEDGNVQSMSFYMSGLGSGAAGDQTFRGLIYADNAGALGALKGTTQNKVLADNAALDWVTVDFASPPALVAGNYHFVLWATGATNGSKIWRSEGGLGTDYIAGYDFADAPPDPGGSRDAEWSPNTMMIYATYTVPATFIPKVIVI